MSEEMSLEEVQKKWHGTLRAYVIGFTGSVVLTALSFILVMTQLLTGRPLVIALIALALIQAAVQVRYFLHVGEESKPRWEMGIFFCMLVVIFIVIAGTLWVMYDLNARVMTEMM